MDERREAYQTALLNLRQLEIYYSIQLRMCTAASRTSCLRSGYVLLYSHIRNYFRFPEFPGVRCRCPLLSFVIRRASTCNAKGTQAWRIGEGRKGTMDGDVLKNRGTRVASLLSGCSPPSRSDTLIRGNKQECLLETRLCECAYFWTVLYAVVIGLSKCCM